MTEWTEWHEKHANKIEIIPGIDCWVWVAGTGSRGYGRVKYIDRSEFAHRAAFIEAKGPIPKGLLVRHMCGVPLCVRPSHLKLGTSADNAKDMAEMFTSKSHLSPLQVREIRRLYGDGVPLTEIAQSFGIAWGSVYPIVSHKSFRHVDPETAGLHAKRSPRKLTPELAARIRRDALSGDHTQSVLATKYGVTQSVISRIKSGDRWSKQ